MQEMITEIFGFGIKLHQEINKFRIDLFIISEQFPGWNTDSAYVRLKIAMQGMSTSSLCSI